MKNTLILFLASFVFILLIYQIFVVSKTKRNRKKGVIKHPMEIQYFVLRYKLDLKKVNYDLLLQTVSVVSAFDVAVIVTLASTIKSYVISIIICFISTFILILITYHIVYLLFRKKGKRND